MRRNISPTFTSIVILLCLPFCLTAQNTIKGTVFSGADPMAGATIVIRESGEGAISSLDGSFSIETAEEYPITLEVSFLGYESREILVESQEQLPLRIEMEESLILLDQVVVGASRFEERIVKAPVTIYKLDARRLRSIGGTDYYDAVKNMKGIQPQSSSLSLQSYNTRGFSDPANFRFKQQIDGIDMTNPIGLSISNSVGASDLDIQSIELIPGASSALYGSDAFNGILRMYTKNPFETAGLSVLTKTGLTSQSVAGSNFFGEFNLRFADVLSEKVAMKVDFHHRSASDWVGSDASHRIPPGQWDNREFFQSKDLDNPDGYALFDAVHRLGDEYGNGIGTINFPVTLTGPAGETLDFAPRELARSGIWEEDLIDNELKDFRLNLALHYRPNEDWELVYAYKHSFSDWLIRSSVAFPQYDYLQRVHFAEARHDIVNIRAYWHKLDNFRGSWSAPNAADAIQQALRPNDLWVADLQERYAETGSLRAAREYADRFMPGGSAFNEQDFEAALAATTNNTDYSGLHTNVIIGSQAIDFSSYLNTDVDLDLSHWFDDFTMLAGANYRRYHIESDGGFYNDGPLGFGEPIVVNQAGAYVQTKDVFFDKRLKVTGALRFDWHEDYDESWSPRLAMVYSAGKENEHNFRASFQSGFRNPSIQEGFFRLQLTSAFTVVGTAQRSIDNFIYEGRSGNLYTLNEIIEADGRGFTAVEPERNTIAEVGYKSILSDRFLVDLNYYHSWYQDFIYRPSIFFNPAGHPEDFQIFAVRQNRQDLVVSQGAGFNLEYKLKPGIHLQASYDWAEFDVPDFEGAEEEKAQLMRQLIFNTPEHSGYLAINAENLGSGDRWGFNIGTHFTSSFIFFSNFGVNELEEANYTNASVSYRIPAWSTTLKLAATNVFGQEYIYAYGAPPTGSIYYLAVRYEEF